MFFWAFGASSETRALELCFFGSFVITRGVHVFELEVAKLALE